MVSPLFHSGNSTWAPSGLAYANGILYTASLRGEMIRTFDIINKREAVFLEGIGRIRDVFIEEENLYLLTNNTDGRGNPRPNDDKLIKLPLSSRKE